ncbi:unnamed protein product [Protopolystoma xenopodis]|uniref:Uncharacterized protein n=1 Tax=Protopolystoma xenopodis TaxID=117903 RepID=A0A3S5FH08_9PLAT|nr:unnamed protein product [Protopolystoma xenopodis]
MYRSQNKLIKVPFNRCFELIFASSKSLLGTTFLAIVNMLSSGLEPLTECSLTRLSDTVDGTVSEKCHHWHRKIQIRVVSILSIEDTKLWFRSSVNPLERCA